MHQKKFATKKNLTKKFYQKQIHTKQAQKLVQVDALDLSL